MKRMTNQRRIILEELKKHVDHPTADEIYTEVRKELPRVSLGTVYRNLERMSELGIILKLEGTGQKRFDPNPMPHPHFRCVKCGKVEDVHMEIEPPALDENSQWCSERTIQGVIMEFYGHCSECKE